MVKWNIITDNLFIKIKLLLIIIVEKREVVNKIHKKQTAPPFESVKPPGREGQTVCRRKALKRSITLASPTIRTRSFWSNA